MTILSTDIKLKQSERMTDFTDGGGQMSATEVVDGVLDNVFSDRSDLDAIYGRVSLRKVYAQVSSANTDTYLGAFAFITDPPADGNVFVSMFDTGSYTDERSDAANYVQNYRIQGVKSQYTLYGLHIVGQMTVQIYCRDSTIPSPQSGDVLMLSTEATGYMPNQQFIKIDKVLSRQTLTFVDGGGAFPLDVMILQITSPLLFVFNGFDPPSRQTANPPTIIRFTQVAATSTYYGIAPFAASATTGDRTVKVTSPYISVVPSSQAETNLTDVLASLGVISMVVSGAAGALSSSTASGAVGAGISVTRYFGTPYARNSLSIAVAGVTLTDDGNGGIASTTLGDTSWSGIADYQTGAYTFAKTSAWNSTIVATATPAGAVLQQTYSMKLDITPTNRDQLSYVQQLPNLPSVGTVVIDYLSLGKWIRLTDAGNGTIVGNPGEGSATINYATGSNAITLGSYADNGSQIVTAWGTDLRTRDVHGEITVPTPTFMQQLLHPGTLPGSCSMTWHTGGVAKSAAVSNAGVVSGDATGIWTFLTSLVTFTTINLPDAGFTFNYSWCDPSMQFSETFTPTPVSNSVSFTLANPPAVGTAHISLVGAVGGGGVTGYNVGFLPVVQNFTDDGSGGITGGNPGTNTINNTTGAVVLSTAIPNTTMYVPTIGYNATDGGVESSVNSWSSQSIPLAFAAGDPITVTYIESGAVATATTETYASPDIQINLSTGSTGAAVPGCVRFTFRGRTYCDRAGSLYYGIDPTTNSGTFGGTYDYAANVATLSDYASGSNTVTINSLLTYYGKTGISNVYFRTPGEPLKIGNFTWRATDLSGNEYTGGADSDGNITGTGAKGLVDWDTGGCVMQFGAYVASAGQTGQPWYDPANVVGSTVWKPTMVDPATIFIGCTVYKYVPLSPTILGLDPVRLPSNGKVLGFQIGGVVAIHNTQVTTVTSPVAAAVTNLGRTRLAFAEIKDSASTPVAIDPVWYTLDLQAGTVTWANPLNLSAYTLPVTIRHRIEDIYVCTDLQITGEITLQSPITHDFPETGTYASACLIYGDMQGRIANIFDQQTWTNVFSDTLIGSPALSSYNNVIYPITAENDSTTQDRWVADFQSSAVVSIIGEVAGNLGNFAIASDIAPINPVSGLPYFTIPHQGWGSGWGAGNALRWNTISATKPTWLLRCTSQGPITVPTDKYRYQIYGNAA